MTMWKPGDLTGRTPLYLALADALEADVHAGRLRAGERLPTHRDLARALGVNVVTVTRGYAEATRRGLIEGEVGRGTFVRERGRRHPSLVLVPEDDSVVDFHFNLPVGDPALLDAAAAFTDFARHVDRVPLHTGYQAAGLEPHRAAGASWMARSGLETDVERTLVCGGAQHGITVTMATLCAPGDVVLTDELTYPGMKALANVLNLRTVAVPGDADGLLPDALGDAVRRQGAQALYLMSTLHNPTGVVMPEARRREIADVARRHGLAFVEDDTYGPLCRKPPPPVTSFAPELGTFVSSTSKTIAAGLRIGYVLAPGPVAVERLAANVAAITWAAAPPMAELAARFIRDGSADRMLAFKRREVAARRRLFRRRLPGHAVLSHPDASHVWLPLPEPWRSEDFAAQARLHGVAVAPAEVFVVGRAQAPHAVRVSLGTPATRELVELGLERLAQVLEGVPAARRSLV